MLARELCFQAFFPLRPPVSQKIERSHIIEDRAGHLWFGGHAGTNYDIQGPLWRYDGTNWRQVTTADGIPNNNVGALFMDHSGAIWISGGATSRYDGTSWRTFTTADGAPGGIKVAICEDQSGVLWVMSALAPFSLYGYDGTTWTRVRPEETAICPTSMCATRTGGIWIGSRGSGCTGGGGVNHFDGLRWRFFGPSSGLVYGSVNRVFEDRSGALWVGTTAGVSRYDGAGWESFTGATDPGFGIRNLLEDSRGNIWCAHSGGSGPGKVVSRYDGTSWRNFTAADGLEVGGHVFDMVMDRDGQVWVASDSGVSVTGDGSSWRTFTTADGLASNQATGLLADRAGHIWVGTESQGVSRYDGVTWQTFTTADGLAHNLGGKMIEDRTGAIWVGAGPWDSWGSSLPTNGVSRYDGVNWRAFTLADGMANRSVHVFLEDRTGAIWCGGAGPGGTALSRFDGESWTAFTAADGVPGPGVLTMLEDRTGGVWVGARDGASRYDGASWRTFTTADGLPGTNIRNIYMDRSGVLWFGTWNTGVGRYDGARWITLTAADGLKDVGNWEILEDSRGALWFGYDGLTRYDPDRVPPQSVFTSKPPRVSANTIPSISYAAGFKEIEGIEFSYSLDGSPWSEWSVTASWPSRSLPDGEHVFEVKARDRLNNVDPTPARAEFLIDATPPVPAIAVPASGQAVRDSLAIRGTANDARFASYRVEVRSVGAGSGTVLYQGTTPVVEGVLCGWNTTALADGDYEVRLSVTDSLGLTGAYPVSVIVDNHAPFADVTAPAKITATEGGDIYTTNSELHLYFPPRAFRADAVVTILPTAEGSVPDTLASGAVLAAPGFDIAWGAADLRKPATLELSYAGAAQAAGVPVVYFSADGTEWLRLGGTVNAETRRISLPIARPGRYGPFAESGAVMGERSLSGISFTPRVFSPTGAFADRQVGIGFSLGRPASVTVRVYSRSGRLIRDVLVNESMNAGANLVRWDGRDRSGRFATDGIYLVTVEALGHTRTKPLAVVR